MMMKKMILVLSALASTAGLMTVTATPAEARPHMMCKRVWVHGHPERRCWPVGRGPHRHGYGPRY